MGKLQTLNDLLLNETIFFKNPVNTDKKCYDIKKKK